MAEGEGGKSFHEEDALQKDTHHQLVTKIQHLVGGWRFGSRYNRGIDCDTSSSSLF